MNPDTRTDTIAGLLATFAAFSYGTGAALTFTDDLTDQS